MLEKNFIEYIEEGITHNWDIQALTDYKGETFTYGETGLTIKLLHQFFGNCGIEPNDKIALIGKNSARWGMIYLSALSFGTVLVPVLPDFKPDDLHHIVNHSDAVMLFADDTIFQKMDIKQMPNLKAVFAISDFSILYTNSEQIRKLHAQSGLMDPLKKDMDSSQFSLPHIPNSNLALISYTSGTTGFTKGVMLQHNSLAANLKYAQTHMPLKQGDNIVSFLPLAHAFGAAFEFLFPFSLGCHITILTKTPAPQIVMQAFHEIKPALVLSVPLVIEKIFKSQIQPVVSKWQMKALLAIPVVNKMIFKKINDKLVNAFGGQFFEIVIGGAPFSKQIERFFMKIKFPFTVGYGMTECGPLISYTSWKTTKIGASGKIVDTLQLRIDSTHPENIPGEILVKGDNVMVGYYKNPELSAEIIDVNGWLHTGDLGTVDNEGNIYIRGRSKSMILGPDGKNIFPDEVESRINSRYGVAESLVVNRKDKLVALIYPDQDIVEKEKLTREDLEKLFEHHMKTVNHQMPHFIQIAQIDIQDKEFVKTPKRSIKRFLYS